MYDDWAYHVSPSQYAPQPSKHGRRRRSILQDGPPMDHAGTKQQPAALDVRGSMLEDAGAVLLKSPALSQTRMTIPEYTVPMRRAKSYSSLRGIDPESDLTAAYGGARPPADELYRSLAQLDLNGDLGALYATQDEIEFAKWYESLEDELQEASDNIFISFKTAALSNLSACDQLLEQASNTMDLCDDLALGFGLVRKQTSTFQDACDVLLAEQTRLETLADDIAAHLEPFNLLDEFTRRLNAPGTDFVTQDAFRTMLKQLDDCIDYVKKNKSFNGVDIYEMRYRQCLTRALTLIRVFFVNSLREVANDVQSRITAKALNDKTQSALFYTKFKVDAPLLQSLTTEIQQRCEDHDEYLSLMRDCYRCYTGIRKRLIMPVITAKVNELKNTTPDLVQLARSSIAYIRTVCVDEYDLFYTLFLEGDEVIYDCLDEICEPLHDVLRNKIIHEKKAEVLYELCSLLQNLANQDSEDILEEDYYSRPHLDFARLFQSTLQDAQVKLVFRMQAYA
ncbi:Sec34-like family-domain-containing protein [Dipodascopsis tothii]|uniref:Sec34-like family-domain-containing protein n=1 Tax=Dipodascopsis tothii TaxID=44089 RepID=UPI0034CD2B3A